MASPVQPKNRSDFEIAIICALRLEADAVEALFDKFWDDDGDIYGKAPGDTNAYTTGVIGRHNVVLAIMPGIGKRNAAAVAANFRSSFGGIRLALVVGICGGVPCGIDEEEILLGDVIVSDGLIQYDFGRQLPDGFVRKDTLNDNLGRQNSEIRAFLARLKGRRGWMRLKEKTFRYLTALRMELGAESARYPGISEDKLFEANYRHKHHDSSICIICAKCETKEDKVCEAALDSLCSELNCSKNKLVSRRRLLNAVEGRDNTEELKPVIHYGLIASGDIVMKSGEHRDEIALREKVIAFEMEGAGVCDNFPCVVIKGVCDYADSHKNKKWQGYAAATAAACMKASLEAWISTDKLLIDTSIHGSKSKLQCPESPESFRHQYYIALASKLAENLPSQVLLSDPVVLYDALDGYFPFFLEYITCTEAFVEIVERRTHQTLEDKYKEQGAAKIRNREFFLHDLESKQRFNLQHQPWNFIMRPGKKRYMSVTFREIEAAKQSCPHCGADNETTEGQHTTCKVCGANYERIVELEDRETYLAQPDSGSKPVPKAVRLGTKKASLPSDPETNLQLAFRRITLTRKARRVIESELPTQNPIFAVGNNIFIPSNNDSLESWVRQKFNYETDYSDNVTEVDYHPLVAEFLSKMGVLDILQERLYERRKEKDELEGKKELQELVGLGLAPKDQEWLDNFGALEAELLKEIAITEAEAAKLEKQCYKYGLVDDEGNPTSLGSWERQNFSHETGMEASSETSEFTKFPALLPRYGTTNTEQQTNDIIENRADRINHWLLTHLISSPLDVNLLARTYESLVGPIEFQDDWQKRVLNLWYEDGMGRKDSSDDTTQPQTPVPASRQLDIRQSRPRSFSDPYARDLKFESQQPSG